MLNPPSMRPPMSLSGSGTYQILLLLLPPFWFPCRVLLPLFLVRLFWFLSRLLFPCRVLSPLRLFWFLFRVLLRLVWFPRRLAFLLQPKNSQAVLLPNWFVLPPFRSCSWIVIRSSGWVIAIQSSGGCVLPQFLPRLLPHHHHPFCSHSQSLLFPFRALLAFLLLLP